MIQATLPRRTAAPLWDLNQLDLNQMARDAMKPWTDDHIQQQNGGARPRDPGAFRLSFRRHPSHSLQQWRAAGIMPCR